MGLGDYNRKRDFRVTTEPPGRPGSTPTGRSFVVQKHDASRLHYDFRLEVDGVLKSWSVPKGPSFDPVVKRLAVAVEDHPIEYGGFEGIIPAGQYGGGTVLLWDRGTWNPLSDPAQSLAAGQLKFELAGEKLLGRWVLVKLKDRPGRRGKHVGPEDRSWLLIKERDEYARPEAEWNVTEARPESVATGRDLEVIAADSDRVWHSNRDRPDPASLRGARAAPMPEEITPAQATMARAVPIGDGWVHELELVGERVICRIDGGRSRFLTADGDDRTSSLQALARAAQALPVQQALVDGVATALGPDGHSSANGPADTFYVFDLPYLDGQDLTRVALVDRKSLLATLVKATGGVAGLRYTDHVVGRGRETFREAGLLGARGVVSKLADSKYRQGPEPVRKAVSKVRTEANKKAEAKTKAHEKAHEKTKGKAHEKAHEKAKEKERAAAATATLKASAEINGDWRVVRCPVGSAARPPTLASPDVAGASGLGRDVRVAGVRLTHPHRVLFPEVGVTKLELARFYEAVASFMLPHVEDRPLTLVRAPDGVTGKSFYVRHAGDWAPQELRQVQIPDGSGSGTTMIADDVAGLVALAQMNVLEVHAWNARASLIEQPDRLVFDLDPGPKVTWSAVVDGAHHVRAALELLDLESFVKTTGSKGLHVVVPLVPEANWDDSLEFSRAVAQAMSRAEPRLYTAVVARKVVREDKILIDYLRNRRGATSVSVYSTRGRPSAPVSTPVSWDDLGPDTRSDTFHVGDLPALLRERADPWANFARVRQRLTPARLKQAQALLGHPR